jgi:hypothetical protein
MLIGDNMEDQLQTALNFANYRQSFSIQRKTLKEKIEAKLTYGFGGGIFKIDRELISFTQTLIDKERAFGVVMLDQNDNPVLVDDLQHFQDDIISRYFEATNEYFEQYQNLKKSRTVEKLLDL